MPTSFSRAQLLPPQQLALLADFVFAQQSALQSPDLEQQAAFAAVWSFASGCELAVSLFISLQQVQSLPVAISLLHESPLQQVFFPEQHFPFLHIPVGEGRTHFQRRPMSQPGRS
jgi:hypothetical protein